MKIGLRQYYGHALKDDYYGNILIIKYESVAAFLAAKKCLDIVPFEDVFFTENVSDNLAFWNRNRIQNLGAALL